MSVPYRITIRVSEDLINQLQEIVEKNQYSSISEAIRLAISEFITRNRTNATSKVDLKLPRNIYGKSFIWHQIRSIMAFALMGNKQGGCHISQRSYKVHLERICKRKN